MQENGSSRLFDGQPLGQAKLKRSLLKDQAIDLLRDLIIGGRLPPGSKLVEQEIAHELGISRAPVRDALLELEKEGLVVSRPNGRYVIELTERDIRELYRVRLAAEKLAVELAAQNCCPENRAALNAKLEEMRQAVANHDRDAYVKSDVETHWLIWHQAQNPHLFRMLHSILGPVFMFVANNAEYFDWHETLALHEDLVRCITDGDGRAAAESIERHLDNALQRSLLALKRPAKAA